jgi:hypothetical protein
VTVFAIKADTLPPDVRTIADIGHALGMAGALDTEIAALANDRRVVLLIDQLDAVSDVMDRSSARMRLLLQLVRKVRDAKLNIHVIVSSRPFDGLVTVLRRSLESLTLDQGDRRDEEAYRGFQA